MSAFKRLTRREELQAVSVPLAVSVSELPPALITASTGNGSVAISTRYLDSQHAQTFKATVSSIQSVSLALAKVGNP